MGSDDDWNNPMTAGHANEIIEWLEAIANRLDHLIAMVGLPGGKR